MMFDGMRGYIPTIPSFKDKEPCDFDTSNMTVEVKELERWQVVERAFLRLKCPSISDWADLNSLSVITGMRIFNIPRRQFFVRGLHEWEPISKENLPCAIEEYFRIKFRDQENSKGPAPFEVVS